MAKKTEPRTKKELMVDLLREAILSGEIQPGERLLQEALAERFKVSQTPIREAIQQLIAEGVLSHSPYRGVQVAEVRPAEAQQVYLIRAALESLATRQAVPNLKLSDVAALRANQLAFEQVAAGGEGSTLQINNTFHQTIYSAAGMPLLEGLIKSLWVKTPWDTLFVIPNRLKDAAAEHRRILDAIEAGDAELAGQRMAEHLEAGARALAAYLEGKSE
jgi:DNA-binding GntR family transcriptional regulator